LRDADLDLVADAEGITGMISQVTLRVMRLTGIQTLALAVYDAYAFQLLLQALIDRRLPIWSMSFINPKMAEMKNEAPLREHHGHPVEQRIILPKAYILTLAFRDADATAVQSAIPGIAAATGAEILSDEIARHEWDGRFKLMTIK
ncbi:MAG: Fe-S oxidoreductase, partial [Phototrophicales bacterium]